jgi:glycosyltransferase involved in cell wall biosynthesis
VKPPARPRLIIASRLFSPEASAAAFRMAAFADAAAERADVVVLTTKPPRGADGGATDDRITVSRAPVLRDRTGAIRGYVQYASFDGPLFFRLLGRRTDVVVAEAPPTTGLVALVASRLKRARLVYYPGDVWTDGLIAMGAPGPVVALMRWMESLVVRRADLVLAISPEVADRIAALGAPAERIALVGNGVDTSVFRPDVPPRHADAPYFVYTGTMSEWQRPEVFVQALALLGDEASDVEIRFFGQGASQDAVRRAAADVPGRVHLGGVVPPAEAAEWIRGAVGALVSIVPDVGYDFARPTKTYAAAAVGTPVLYAGAPTGAEVVREGDLGEVADFTPRSIADAMRRLIGAWRSGATDSARPARAQWARDHVSLAAVGERAVDSALREARGGNR